VPSLKLSSVKQAAELSQQTQVDVRTPQERMEEAARVVLVFNFAQE
jgi:hypothetical protein